LRTLIGRLFRVIGLLLLLTLLGTLGYRVIEDWSWADSLYMTVITLSTVGFQEARPLSAEGRVFTVAVIVAGSGVALYLLSLGARLVLDGNLPQTYRRERMRMRIRNKRDHVIVGGYGRYGRAVVEELLAAKRTVVVVDENPELVSLLEDRNLAYVIGPASSDEVLHEAGIEGARDIVAATPSDAENVFITLAAKELNSKIRVHSRYETEAAARRLLRAGADRVVSPFLMGGTRTAASILQPSVVDFLELVSPHSKPAVDLEEVEVASGSALINNTLEELEGLCSGLRVVALRGADREIQIVPSATTRVASGDLLVVIGERPALRDLAERAAPSTR
jgi:voltage-gated potassium channel